MSAPLRRIAAVAAAALLALPCADAIAASQLFKCIEGGRTVYQQQACPVGAQPEATTRTAAAKASAPVADAASAAPRRLKSASPASSAPARRR